MKKKNIVKKASRAERPSETSLLSRVAGVINAYLDQDVDTNIVEAILADHQTLKDLLKILKDSEESLDRKKTAFKLFKSLLRSHSEAEEKALYALSAHLRGTELKTVEGFVEHHVANGLLDKIKAPSAKGRKLFWRAQVQVLAELVEHHLAEEERDLLPQIRKKIDAKTLARSSKKFLSLRRASQKIRSKRNKGALAKSKGAKRT